MMFKLADIRRLLDAFENSDWNEIQLSSEGVEVYISTGEGEAPAIAPLANAPAAPRAAAPAAPAPVAEPASVAAAALDEDPPGHAVRAPSPGLFWRSPAPGAPPFVEVGQRIEAGAVTCIVEVMKLMNQVMCEVGGTVAAVLVENGARVERGQALFIVTDDGPAA